MSSAYRDIVEKMQEEREGLLAEIARRDAALHEAESEARRFAGCYPHGSDGRNTFVMLADKIAALQPSETPKEDI